MSKKQLIIHKTNYYNSKWSCWLSFPGIPPHIDTHSAFEDTILSLSLGAQVRSPCFTLFISFFLFSCIGWQSFDNNVLAVQENICLFTWRHCHKVLLIPNNETQTHAIIVIAFVETTSVFIRVRSFQTVMDFRHPDGCLVALVLPGRSLLVMKGESRYLWTHGWAWISYDDLLLFGSWAVLFLLSGLPLVNLMWSHPGTHNPLLKHHMTTRARAISL